MCRGFSLVIAVIGVLTGISIPFMQRIKNESKLFRNRANAKYMANVAYSAYTA